MKANFQKAFVELHNNRKSRGMKSVDEWKDGLEMFDWWLSDEPKSDPDQT